MTDAIKLLEQLASNAIFKNSENKRKLIERSNVADSLKSAILDNDSLMLKEQLTLTHNTCCFIVLPE